MAATKAWTTTVISQVQLSFTWSLDKISRLLHQKKGLKVIRSPNFFSDADPDTQWYLELHPRGREDDKDFISLFLTLDASVQSEVYVNYKFSVINGSGVTTCVHREEARFHDGDVRGREQFLIRSQVLDKSKNVCPDDTLTVECDLTQSHVAHTSRSQKKTPTLSSQVNLANDFSSLLGDVRYSDVTFHVRNREFPAHRFFSSIYKQKFI